MALYLVCALAGQRVALPAQDVDSVVEIERLTPVPRAAGHIAGLAALRSRVLTVIDSGAALGIVAGSQEAEAEAPQTVIVTIEGHLYGLQVGAVDDVVETEAAVQPLAAMPEPGWARVARGMIEISGTALLLLDPAALISPAPEA